MNQQYRQVVVKKPFLRQLWKMRMQLVDGAIQRVESVAPYTTSTAVKHPLSFHQS